MSDDDDFKSAVETAKSMCKPVTKPVKEAATKLFVALVESINAQLASYMGAKQQVQLDGSTDMRAVLEVTEYFKTTGWNVDVIPPDGTLNTIRLIFS